MQQATDNPAGERVWARMRPVVLVLVLGGVGHTLVCWIALQLDFFRGSSVFFSNLFTAIWSGHVALILLAAAGVNRLLPDRDMILPVVVWSTLVLLVTAYYVDQVRLCVMMILFAVLQVGVFRMRLRGFAVVSAFAILAYAGIIALVHRQHPEALDVFAELIQWLVFSIMAIAFVVLAGEISGIREQVSERNRELGNIVERIQDMAIKDELTGLYNRRHALERLHKIREMADRGAFDFVLAYVDLDHFKDVNDDYGHQVGDDVLRVFARTAQQLVSGRDFCARLGGEEFLLVLVKTDLDNAEQLANRLRHSLADARIDGAPDLIVTASIGLARFHAGESLDALLARADDALYQAKDSGRDRVVRAREDTA